MTEKPRVVDGADRRKQRLLELLVYVENNKGASATEIKGFMTMRFGLTWKTTATYMEELHLSKLIALREGRWYVTGNYKRYAKYLYGE